MASWNLLPLLFLSKTAPGPPPPYVRDTYVFTVRALYEVVHVDELFRCGLYA